MTSRVLVIDDEADTAELLRRGLESAGFQVETVSSGRAGRRRLVARDVDLVLLDYRMQDEDGITCLHAIRRLHPEVPVIVMSGHGSEEIAVEAMKAGAVDYVVKDGRWLQTVCRRVSSAIERTVGGRESPGTPAGTLPPASAEAELAATLASWARAGVPPDAGPMLRRTVETAAAASLGLRHEAAARGYAAALDLLGTCRSAAPRLEVALLTAQAEVAWRAGNLAEARAAAARALERVRPLGDADGLARAALGYAGRLQGFGAAVCDPEVVAVLEEALAALPPDDSPLRALLMARLSEELATAPASGDRLTLGREAVRMARRLEEPALLAAVLQTTHWSLWQPEELDDRRQLAEEVITLAEGVGDAAMQLEGQLLRTWCLLDAGDFVAVEEELDAAALRNAGVRLPYYAWLIAIARACLAFTGGRLQDVEALAAEALSLGHQAENPNARLFFTAQVASLAWLTGRSGEVETLVANIVQQFPALEPVVECALAVIQAESGRLDAARASFESAMRDGSWRTIRNVTWLPAVMYLAEACAALDDAERAEELYELLRPFDGRMVTLPPVVIYSPVSHELGQLAAVRRQWDLAARHFDAAMDLEGRAQMRWWLARTQAAYAAMLLQRRRPEDVFLAQSLLAAAERTAEGVGMPGVLERARVLQAEAVAAAAGVVPAPPPPPARPNGKARAVFRCDGDFWTLVFAGERGLVRDARGLHYLRSLLERPGQEIPAFELVVGPVGPAGEPARQQRGVPLGADGRALVDYRARLREIAAAVAEAERDGAAVDLPLLRAESEELQAQIEASVGFGGRPRLAGDPTQKARIAVRKAIDHVLARLRESMPVLAHHLHTHVKTGAFCVYRADPAQPVEWVTRS